MVIDSSNSYLIINALLYVLTFISYLKNRKIIGAVKLILAIYAISALGAIALYNHPLYLEENKQISLFPFIYLYVMFMIITQN